MIRMKWTLKIKSKSISMFQISIKDRIQRPQAKDNKNNPFLISLIHQDNLVCLRKDSKISKGIMTKFANLIC